MTWPTWRQFRTQAITVYAGIVVLVVFLAATRGHLLRVTAGDPATALQDVTEAQGVLYLVGTVVVALLPAVIGTFWGAPLVTRELEAGTHHPGLEPVRDPDPLARGQARPHRCDGDRRGRAGQPGVHLVGGSDRPARGARRGLRPTRPHRSLHCSTRGIASAGHAAFAFVLGVTMGIIIRRTVPAMAVTLAIFIAVQIAVPLWVRPHHSADRPDGGGR